MNEWTSLAAALAGLLLITCLAWPSRETRMRRRRARVAKLIAAYYRNQHCEVAGADRPVTVAELLERAAAEQKTRQERRDYLPDDGGAPTDMLPLVR